MINVAIIDDHPLALTGLQHMFSSFDLIHVSGLFTSVNDLMHALEQERPDILLMDIQLKEQKGWDLAAIITRQYPAIKIIAITSFDAISYVKAMMRSGCKGYILKNTDQQTLYSAIMRVHNGEEYIEPSLKEQMLQNLLHFQKQPKKDLPGLTRREKEILQYIVEENTSQEIADKLFISLRTVESHRFNIQQKLQVKNNIGLIKLAIEMGIYKKE